ncbi:MAG: hypothetical protein HC809_13140 [Gammaproteobacteria bacterium]|nr:hypothetical protein [Gammaproteobacteria bacterium]
MKLTDNAGDPALADPLPADPFPVLVRWLADARGAAYVNPDAICVSTVGPMGRHAVAWCCAEVSMPSAGD